MESQSCFGSPVFSEVMHMEFLTVILVLAGCCAAVVCICQTIIRRRNRFLARENRCVVCGNIIPEGLMVCQNCERKVMDHGN